MLLVGPHGSAIVQERKVYYFRRKAFDFSNLAKHKLLSAHYSEDTRSNREEVKILDFAD